MGPDLHLTYLLTQIGWAAPSTITAVVIGIVALLRRDAGLWWKLVVGGVAVLLAGQLTSLVGNLLLLQIDGFYRGYWLVTIPTVILSAVGLALIGAGAVSGRRGQATPR